MPHFDDLYLFITIVESGSFTKAAEKLGISKSTLSQSLSNLESRLNIRLLNRTTRSVSPTPEGLMLYKDIAEHYAAIGLGLDKLSDHLDTATGTVRINANLLAMDTVILPKLSPLLNNNPLISIELYSENRFIDIIEQGFDIGVRLGNEVADGMVAIQISPPVQTTLVATPEYLHGKPAPNEIKDLDKHRLIALRLDTNRPPLTWDFNLGGQIVEYTPKAQVLYNMNPLQAIKNHLGIGFVGVAQVEKELESGKLIEILGRFRMTYPPFYAYYPNRKYHSKAFETVLNTLKEA